MASDDESVEIKLVSTPPRLSEKEKKAKKIELEIICGLDLVPWNLLE